jgi:hypothetical protein
MTTPNTLQDIRTKIRRITARSSQDQISDAEIDRYINTYYLYDLPESLRLLKLKDIFTFTTQPNIEVYPFDSVNYVTCEGPAYVGGQQIQYMQDIDLFYREWPKINFLQQVGTASTALGAGPYSGVITGTPFLRSINPNGQNPALNVGTDIRLIISADTSTSSATTAYDDGNGGFIDSVTKLPLAGTIDYITGNFTVTFSSTPSNGAQINAAVIPYQPSEPRCILYYQNQFLLRPVPDQAYICEVVAFRFPTALVNNNQSPELQQWWQLIAYGAAMKILEDNADFENRNNFQPYFIDQLLLVQRRTIKQLTNQRASTIYSDSGQYPYSNLYPFI